MVISFSLPQPTTSPNDPLNWSLPRKYWHAFLVCFITGLTAATSNDAGSTQYGQNTDLNISYNAMNTAAGVLFIGIGYWTLLMSPAAWLYGRRITYLVMLDLRRSRRNLAGKSEDDQRLGLEPIVCGSFRSMRRSQCAAFALGSLLSAPKGDCHWYLRAGYKHWHISRTVNWRLYR